MQTVTERLEDVQTAITSVLLNQQYEINGRMVRRADLQDLLNLEKYLTEKLQDDGNLPEINSPRRASVSLEFV